MTYYDQVAEAVEYVRGTVGKMPDIAVVLGSGLGDFAKRVANARTISYSDIPHWPPSAVVGHAGKLVLGELCGKQVAVLAGRAHFYEGHELLRATFSIRVLGLLGVKTIILPKWNKKDLEEIPAKVKREITFHFVDEMLEVLRLALDK